MTKIRNPLSIENVLSNMISKLDEDEVKNLTNKSISHFRKCSDPDDKDHNLYLSDAIKLDVIMQRNSLGTPLMDNFQIMLDEEFKKVNSFENLENTLLKVGGRVGNLMDVVQDENNKKKVTKEFQKYIDCEGDYSGAGYAIILNGKLAY